MSDKTHKIQIDIWNKYKNETKESLLEIISNQDKEIEILNKENTILNNIRNKAIEYINSDEMLKLREEFEYCNDKDLFDDFAGHLDKILRGDKE